ncbi:MAG: phage minor head protein [Pseudomonadota bacterium]
MTRVDFEALPNEEAIAFFRQKGFAPALSRFSWRDVWADEHTRMFTVAKAMRDDVLSEIREALDTAIAEGVPFEQFKQELEPKLRAFGWWGRGIVEDPLTGQRVEAQLGSARRLRIIYDTNLRSANAAGRWSRVQRNKRLMPFLTYVQIDRPSKRAAHEPFDGVTLPVDHPFWLTHYPPNGWRCGCLVRQVSARTMRREGLIVTDDERLQLLLQTREVVNERRGETVQVPFGIDPGFEHNPGVRRHEPA